MRNYLYLFRISIFTALSIALAGAAGSAVHAVANDESKLIEGAKLCTNYLPRQERQFGIPVHLLAAIATTESGRYHKPLGMSLPWPWTINVEGKGYFFDTKEEAVAAVKGFQEKGIKSIDVGCMQVNLHHHRGAFASVEDALDPAYNITYAAQFLKRNFDEENSWRKAAADYHSHTPMFGEPYANLVFNHWSKIINKVADARAGKIVLKAEPAKPDAEYARNSSTKPRHTYHGVHLISISVSKGTTRENGVLVIRPDKPAVQVASAATRFEDKFVTRVPLRKETAEAPVKNTQEKAEEKPARPKGQFEPASAHLIRSGNNSPPAAEAALNKNSAFVFDN